MPSRLHCQEWIVRLCAVLDGIEASARPFEAAEAIRDPASREGASIGRVIIYLKNRRGLNMGEPTQVSWRVSRRCSMQRQ
jgi:hypothetical protein